MSMTEIEAIEVLKQPCYCDYDLSATIEDCDISSCDKRDAFKLAINALEKQIPKKPTLEADGYSDGQLIYDTWICPYCEKRYETEYDNYDYCPNCGQAIDWSDWNEL